ncbi:hypothetical protein N336_05864, partial [Phalacrocorax carbo]
LPKGISEGELQWTYCSPWTPWPLSAKTRFSVIPLAEGKAKAQRSCSNSFFTQDLLQKAAKK